jgi:hypothetical protein
MRWKIETYTSIIASACAIVVIRTTLKFYLDGSTA